MSGDLGDAVVLARRRGDLLLVLRGTWERRCALVVVPPAHGILELAHALAERAADLGHPRGAEEQKHDDKEDEDFGKPDSKGHKRTIAASSGASGAGWARCYHGPRGRAEGPPFLRQGKE